MRDITTFLLFALALTCATVASITARHCVRLHHELQQARERLGEVMPAR